MEHKSQLVIANFQNQKTILYMPKWPKEIERSKILFIPK